MLLKECVAGSRRTALLRTGDGMSGDKIGDVCTQYPARLYCDTAFGAADVSHHSGLIEMANNPLQYRCDRTQGHSQNHHISPFNSAGGIISNIIDDSQCQCRFQISAAAPTADDPAAITRIFQYPGQRSADQADADDGQLRNDRRLWHWVVSVLLFRAGDFSGTATVEKL